MKIKFLFFIFYLLFLGSFFENAEADVSFSDVGAGTTTDGGYTVTDPTVFVLGTPVATRYIRIEIRNDGSLGHSSYAELRNIKAWAGGSTNVLKGIYSGGSAQVVEINSYNGASPYQSNLSVDCSQSWYPQGSLCDEGSGADSKTISSKSNVNSGATWYVGSADDTGVLVIDMGSVQALTELRIFQMFSDGKTTQIRFAYHPETSDTLPEWDDCGWSTFTRNPQEDLGKCEDDVEDETEDETEDVVEESNESAQYKHYKEEYKHHAAKRTYQKIKHLKKGNDVEFAHYQSLKMNHKKYKHLSKRERKLILTEQEFTDFEMYKDYRGYKKYKELKKNK